jgi:hypothetical protein
MMEKRTLLKPEGNRNTAIRPFGTLNELLLLIRPLKGSKN